MSLDLKHSDRLLLVAPHPDDESLGFAGLIQRALHAKAEIRVLFVTNGEDNPWPQRWIEKRWQIGPGDQRRWAITRRREARQALKTLGFPGKARFLNFPDQGITKRLLDGGPETLDRLCVELDNWAPTLLVTPSAHDLHPDHNALSVLFQLALDRLGLEGRVRHVQYLVHSRKPELVPHRLSLELFMQEVHVKRQAILCHQTQMAISRKRFVAYAKPVEIYFKPAAAKRVTNRQSIREAFVQAGALQLTISLSPRLRNGGVLWIVAESCSHGSLRWLLKIPKTTGKATVCDMATGRPLRNATVRMKRRFAVVKIPIASYQPFSRIFLKLKTPTLFLDDSGWREVCLPQRIPSPLKQGAREEKKSTQIGPASL